MNSSITNFQIEIGKILKPHGIRGEAKISLFNTSSRVLQKESKVILKNGRGVQGEFRIETIRYSPGNAIVKFFDISTIDEIDPHVGNIILINRENLPDAEEGEYYLADLIGMTVFTVDRERMGFVKDVRCYPANDVIMFDFMGNEVIIPIIDEFIPKINFDDKCLIVKPIEGLIGR